MRVTHYGAGVADPRRSGKTRISMISNPVGALFRSARQSKMVISSP